MAVKQSLMTENSQIDSDGRLRTLAGIVTRREIIHSSQSGVATGTDHKLPGRTAGTSVGFARKPMRTDGQREYCTALNDEPELDMPGFIDNNTIGCRDSIDVRETRSS